MTQPSTTQRRIDRMSVIAALLPSGAVLAIALSGCVVRLAFGHWPRVYQDAARWPLTLAAAVLAMVAASSWPAMVGLAVLLSIIRAAYRARPVFNRWLISACIGAAVLYLLCMMDPYGFSRMGLRLIRLWVVAARKRGCHPRVTVASA